MKPFKINNDYIINVDQITYVDLNLMGGIKIYFAGGTDLFLGKESAEKFKNWLSSQSDRG